MKDIVPPLLFYFKALESGVGEGSVLGPLDVTITAKRAMEAVGKDLPHCLCG